MICILNVEGGEVKGWLLASDIDDARRQAYAARAHELAEYLYRLPAEPPAGKHILPTGEVMLVG